MQPIEGLLVGRLFIGQHREQFLGEGANAPFHMEKGRGGIWRGEGDSPSGEGSSLSLAARPLARRRKLDRGGD